jgi:hypothetical protein
MRGHAASVVYMLPVDERGAEGRVEEVVLDEYTRDGRIIRR